MVYLAEGISDMKGCWGASKVPDTDTKRLPLLGPVTSKRNPENHFRHPGRLPQHSFPLNLGPCCQRCLWERTLEVQADRRLLKLHPHWATVTDRLWEAGLLPGALAPGQL